MFVEVCESDDVPPNSNKAFQIEDTSILICNADGEFYAVENCCTHQATPLEGGRIRRGHISCPLHGVMFELTSGVPKGTLTRKALKTFPVRNEGGVVRVDIG